MNRLVNTDIIIQLIGRFVIKGVYFSDKSLRKSDFFILSFSSRANFPQQKKILLGPHILSPKQSFQFFSILSKS